MRVCFLSRDESLSDPLTASGPRRTRRQYRGKNLTGEPWNPRLHGWIQDQGLDRVTERVNRGEKPENVGKGGSIVHMIVLVGLAYGVEGLTEVAAVDVLAGLMHVGKDDKDLLVGVASNGVRSQFGDLEAELLHVLLEGLAPVKGVL